MTVSTVPMEPAADCDRRLGFHRLSATGEYARRPMLANGVAETKSERSSGSTNSGLASIRVRVLPRRFDARSNRVSKQGI